MNRFMRTEMVLGSNAMKKLKDANVIVFGVGGVGGFVCEALARTGVGNISLVDNDVVSETNINRQIIALTSTIGKPKVLAMQERIKDINPSCNVTVFNQFYDENHKIDIASYDYVVDCIDTVTSKLLLIDESINNNVRIISSMGTGNKLDPTRLRISDISKTSVCPLARVMRTLLRKRGINHLPVLFSDEEPVSAYLDEGRHIPGSISFVPASAGLIIASKVIRDLGEINDREGKH